MLRPGRVCIPGVGNTLPARAAAETISVSPIAAGGVRQLAAMIRLGNASGNGSYSAIRSARTVDTPRPKFTILRNSPTIRNCG